MFLINSKKYALTTCLAKRIDGERESVKGMKITDPMFGIGRTTREMRRKAIPSPVNAKIYT